MRQAFVKVALALIITLLSCNLSTAQRLEWARGGGTTSGTWGTGGDPHESTQRMCTDQTGNIYALSSIASSGVTADTFYSSAGYGSHNLLITSYNCEGQMRWAKFCYSTDGCEPIDIICDKSGNVYVAGSFYRNHGTAKIGSDTVLSGSSYIAAGIVQFDTNGNYHWINMLGDNSRATALGSTGKYGALTLDRNGQVHYVKSFLSGVPLTSSVTTVNGTYDLTFSSSGSITSIKRLQLDSANYIKNASLDTTSGKLFIQGTTYSTFSTTYYRGFVACFDTNRNSIWMDTMISSSISSGFYGIITDQNNHLYVTGGSFGYFVYRGDTIRNGFGSGIQAFIIKTDTAGNRQWITSYSGTLSNGLLGLTIMPGNKIAACGGLLGQVATAHDSIISYATETYNSYFTVLDTAGGVISLNQIHGNSSHDVAYCIVSDKIGNLYIGGQGDSVWMDSVGYRSHGGSTDFFVMKYGVDCNCSSMPIAWYDTTRSGAGGATVAFNYTGTTTGLDSVRWYFGDGSTSTSFSPTHTYSTIDTYYACIYIYSGCGNDRHCVDIAIPCLSAPSASFSTSGITATRSFTYTGTTAGIDSLVWSFGDGSRTTGTSVSHAYTTTGSYAVCVTAYNHCGSDVSCSTIAIPCLSAPTASYSSIGTITTKTFTYTGTSVSIDSIVWKFGDGTRATGTTATHTYSTIGTFTACVYAYNPCGVDTSCTTISIPCLVAPVASFTHSGIPVTTFNYTASTAGVDSIVWQFGDGSRGTGSTITHTYTAIDTVTACVTAYSRCGNDSACSTIIIPCIAAPIASATASGSGHTWTLTYTGTTPMLDSLTWRYGDGTTGYGGTTIHTFAAAGTYNVCVAAYNGCGWDSACVTVVVPCDTIVASFSDTGAAAVGFLYTGALAYLDSIVWLYGDGSRDTGRNTTHTYTANGTYNVCVIAYSNCAVDSACRDVLVTGLGIDGTIIGNDIKIYPNATTSILHIQCAIAVQVRILSIDGKVLIKKEDATTVDVTELTPGMYLINVYDSNNMLLKTDRFIKAE